MEWWTISLLLSLYGFFHEYKPSEAYVAQYYVDYKNVTAEQYNSDITPVGQFTWMVLLVVLFLFTDYLRYKPIVILGAILGTLAFSFQTWLHGLWQMQLTEATWGAFSACEVAYYTYMYAKVDPKHYQKVTGHARAAYMFGRSMAAISGQLLSEYEILDQQQLHYITVSSLVLCCVISVCLPSVSESTYFHRKEDGEDEVIPDDVKQTKFKKAFFHLRKDFVDAFTNPYIIKWSVWWAVATAIFYLISSFAQLLWTTISQEADPDLKLYNGYVEFLNTLLGASSAFVIGFFNVPFDRFGDGILAVVSLIQGFALLYSAFSKILIPVYVLHIVNGTLYQGAITIATSEVAKHIREDSYALVFGVNMFLGITLEVIISAILLQGFNPPIRTQFKVYGGVYILLGIAFVCFTCWKLVMSCTKSDKQKNNRNNESS